MSDDFIETIRANEVEIAEIEKSKRENLRITRTHYEDTEYIDARIWTRDAHTGESETATGKGLFLRREQWPEVLEVIEAGLEDSADG